MNPFDVAALLVVLAAVLGFCNYHLLKLPHTIGLTVMGAVASLGVLALDGLLAATLLQHRGLLRVQLQELCVDVPGRLGRLVLCVVLRGDASHGAGIVSSEPGDVKPGRPGAPLGDPTWLADGPRRTGFSRRGLLRHSNCISKVHPDYFRQNEKF